MTWKVVPYQDYEKPKKEYTKKYREEMMAIASNFRTLTLALEDGCKVEQLKKFGFVHSEPSEMIAIDETACDKKRNRKLSGYIYLLMLWKKKYT